MSARTVLGVVGNPRPESRTHGVCRTLAAELAGALPNMATAEIDLSAIGARVLEPDDEQAVSATERVFAADVLIVASPTYKATYTGLLKAFLDRIGTNALADKLAVPILVGGLPSHALAVDVHLTPLLLELGATVPARGLFVLESELDTFPQRARRWWQSTEGRCSERWRNNGLEAVTV